MPTPISRADAITRVKALTEWDEFPMVQEALVEAFVDDAARPDAAANATTSDDWTPTYDLNAAAAAVWEVKMAHVANRYDINTDGQQLDRSQLLAHCTAMARMYRNRIASRFRRAPYADLTDPAL